MKQVDTSRGAGSARTVVVGLVAALLLSVGIGFVYVRSIVRENKLALFHIGALVTRIEDFRSDVGRLPESLDELEAHPTGSGVNRLDPWGRSILYQPDGDGYRLTSLGRDGTSSDDDVDYSHRESVSR